MRLWALGLVGLLFMPGCFYTAHTGWRMQHNEPFEEIVTAGQPCYETVHGITVQSVGGACPAQALVEVETQRLLDYEDADAFALAGLTVVFSSSRPSCMSLGGCVGMTDGASAVVHYFDWARILKHEEFHVLLWRENGDPDPAHFDVRWEWYRLMDRAP